MRLLTLGFYYGRIFTEVWDVDDVLLMWNALFCWEAGERRVGLLEGQCCKTPIHWSVLELLFASRFSLGAGIHFVFLLIEGLNINNYWVLDALHA